MAFNEVFMEQGVAGPYTTTEYKAGFGPLPLEDTESADMSRLDSQLSDATAHPGYPFSRYKRVLYGAPIMLPKAHRYHLPLMQPTCPYCMGIFIVWCSIDKKSTAASTMVKK